MGVSYFGNRILRHVTADMGGLVDLGYTGVLHTMSENDLAYYRDQIGHIVAASHDAGLEVQVGAWGVGGVFGGEAESIFAMRFPELGQVFASGRRVGSACPSRPEFRSYLLEWATAAVEAGADRVFWDEPHWAHPRRFDEPDENWTCVCDSCRSLFAERFGEPLPGELTPQVSAFREQVLVELLTDGVAHVRSLGGRSTICVLPPVKDVHVGIDDWEPVASIAGLDTLATDPYWSFFDLDVEDFVGGQSRRLATTATDHGLTPQIWVQGFQLGPEHAGEIETAVVAAREAGVDDLWTWGYEACGHLTHLGTREPERVWADLTRALTGHEHRGETDG